MLVQELTGQQSQSQIHLITIRTSKILREQLLITMLYSLVLLTCPWIIVSPEVMLSPLQAVTFGLFPLTIE